MSKLKDPDFLNIFQNYDILFFQETKTDNLDHLSLPDGFTYVAKHRKKCLRKSGGIVTIFKKSLAHLLEFPDTSSEYVQWVKIDSSIFGTDKMFCLETSIFPPKTQNIHVWMHLMKLNQTCFNYLNIVISLAF